MLIFFSLVGLLVTHIPILPSPTSVNHPSALAFEDHVQHFIDTELSFNSLAGPFNVNPLPHPLVCSPLQTVPKRYSQKRRVVMDLSSPPGYSVNSSILSGEYLDVTAPFNFDYRV